MSLPNEEKRHIKQQYRSHVLFRLCRKVRDKFQDMHPAVIIGVEELFRDTVTWLNVLLTAGNETMERCSDLWNDLLEMYWHRNSQFEKVESSLVKVVIQFYMLIYCLRCAPSTDERDLLVKMLHNIIYQRWGHQQCEQIVQELAPEVEHFREEMKEWMTAYVSDSHSLLDSGRLPLPEELDTERAQKYFPMAIAKGWMSYAEGRFIWHGLTKKGAATQLAYFCGKVYECCYSDTASGNTGKQLPEQALQELFGVKRLHSLLSQAYNAISPQRWRSAIDALFL